MDVFSKTTPRPHLASRKKPLGLFPRPMVFVQPPEELPLAFRPNPPCALSFSVAVICGMHAHSSTLQCSPPPVPILLSSQANSHLKMDIRHNTLLLKPVKALTELGTIPQSSIQVQHGAAACLSSSESASFFHGQYNISSRLED